MTVVVVASDGGRPLKVASDGSRKSTVRFVQNLIIILLI